MVSLWLCGLLIVLGCADRVAAQSISVDPATALQAASGTIAFNHTVGTGTNRYLIVSVAIERDDAIVASVTYAGQALTFLGRVTDAGGGATLDVWGRVAPASGTNQVVVNLTRSAAVVVGAISFANVSQTSPIAASTLTSGTGAFSASASVASASDQLVVATLAANDEVISAITGSGQTSRWNVVNLADVIGAASTRTGVNGSTTMSYAFALFGRWTLGLFALRPADPLIVTNTNDSGSGSLRDAIQFANSNPGADTITFAIPGAGPHTITLSTTLPNLTDNDTVIDGTTQAGTQCRDLWAGSGHDLRVNVRGGGFNGLLLSGSNQTIRGLSLTGFDNAIIAQASSNAATIQCNYLGLLPNGTSSGNTRGVVAKGAGVVIGGLDAGQGNVISANSIVGVLTEQGSTNTAIRGNFIGTDPAGMSARANAGGGINNFFGIATWRDITRNLISGNSGSGAIALESDDQISPSDGQIRIQRNIIGFTRDLSALMRNGGDGIRFAAGSIANVLIGGTAASEGNHITGTEQGLSLGNTPNVFIRGNVIARAGQDGIRLTAANGVTLGGDATTLGNVIGGNGASGIAVIDGSSNVAVLGNTIGAVTITGATFENQERGIFVRNVSNLVIGDGTAGGRNVIARNGLTAIEAADGPITDVTIIGNYIGTDASGNSAVANGVRADPFNRDAIVVINATITNLSILDNVIGGHDASLIALWASTGSGVTIRGNSIGMGADGTSAITSANIEPLIQIGGGSSLSGLVIGGNGAGEGNIIAFGANAGIDLDMAAGSAQIIGNTIRNTGGYGVGVRGAAPAAIGANRIFANTGLGIDLGADGVTPNDPGDGDNGPNDLLNFPDAIRAVVKGTNQLGYAFTLDAPAAANGYRIEFFASSAADPSGFGEGERYLGHVDISHFGSAQRYTGTLTTLEPVSIGEAISATTTRRTAAGERDITSEFSAVATADGIAALTVAMTSQLFDPPADAAFFVPGNDVLLTATISNGGTGSTDPDSVFVAIAIDPAITFFNAGTPLLGGVAGFNSGTPMLTFTPATDLRFSNAAAAPASFADCNYTPAVGYDAQVRHVCLNPKGSLPKGTSGAQFSVQIGARIN